VYVRSNPKDGVAQPLHAGERVVTAGALGLGGELVIQRANQTGADAHHAESDAPKVGLVR
jgi:hypothetical protein